MGRSEVEDLISEYLSRGQESSDTSHERNRAVYVLVNSYSSSLSSGCATSFRLLCINWLGNQYHQREKNHVIIVQWFSKQSSSVYTVEAQGINPPCSVRLLRVFPIFIPLLTYYHCCASPSSLCIVHLLLKSLRFKGCQVSLQSPARIVTGTNEKVCKVRERPRAVSDAFVDIIFFQEKKLN